MPPSSPADDAWPGRLVGGRWRILSLLDDSGGMASVYLAEDERLPRKAVVKIPRAAQFNAEFVERFAREAFWHAKVENLHVVHILDRGEEEGTPYLVLQYLPGGNLKAWCGRNPSILADPRLHYDAWLLPIAQALDAVAAQGIVHRDVKPSNILFDASGQAYLSDFGIVKAGGEATMTGTGLFIGTIQFMSPEQCQPESKVTLDGRSDQYGLAVTAYQVLTGWKYPVEDTTIGPIFMAKLGLAPLKQPIEHDPRIPPAVNDAVMRALSTARESRFAKSVDFANQVLNSFHGNRQRDAQPRWPVAADGARTRAVKARGSARALPAAGPSTGAPDRKRAGMRGVTSLLLGLVAAVIGSVLLLIGFRSLIGNTPLPGWVRETASRPVETLYSSIGMRLARIDAGSFEMGSYDGEGDEKPVHFVAIRRPFFLGTTEVTKEQYEQVMRSSPWPHEEEVRGTVQAPATHVSWDDANTFCRRLTEIDRRAGVLPPGRVYRLPTEEEWEYACRAGTTTRFSFGDEATQLTTHGWFKTNAADVGKNQAQGVGGKLPNPWGLYDMHGNVWEWCEDLKTEYRLDGAAEPSANSRVLRGGSWLREATHCRSANRSSRPPEDRGSSVGFRVACGWE